MRKRRYWNGAKHHYFPRRPFRRVYRRAGATGNYGSASDVVRAGLRLLEEQEAKLKALEAALKEGEESGPATKFDYNDFLAWKQAQYNAQKGQ
ncbi:hypothetical protein GCM10011491_07220 [Brucella endophytica]|uniref:Type II toxin-antitoxin system ParD family antitoxin n=1 Tax=Brucella endophytica TaxID=1963359 RepID=A0A916S5S8_9HYPH|nr:hypothetical protein GCM10011491_07220 [Brucella endophytica]